MNALSLNNQLELLNFCIKNDLSLHQELQNLNCSYDDLIYRHNPQNLFNHNESSYSLEDYHYTPNHIPFVSFFTGSGGFDLGFDIAGFKHLASLEIMELFAETLLVNRPNWHIFAPPDHSGDVRHHDAVITFLQKVGVTKKFEGIFFGGPPCQPFSIASNQRFSKSDVLFKRVGFANEAQGNLLFDYVHYITYFKPRVFIIENVPGLRTIDNGQQLNTALQILSENGYAIVAPTVLDASNYGVPQQRQRLIIVGSRGQRTFEFPTIEPAKSSAWSALKKPLTGLFNHVTRNHEASSVLRYMELHYGQRDHLGRVDRLDPNKPSKTVIAGGNKGGGRSHLHPFIPRTLSVRESARLQTFPDDYIFCGTPSRQFTQVGNAVPPLLALKIARKVHEMYEKAH